MNKFMLYKPFWWVLHLIAVGFMFWLGSMANF